MKFKLLLTSICFLLMGVLAPSVSSSAEELQEYTVQLSDEEFHKVIEESASEIFNTRYNSYAMNWTIKKNTRRTTSMFYMSSGTSIEIGVELSIWGKAGIIGFDGVARYVQGCSIYKSFDINTSQYYCVYIQNDNTVNMTSSGYYFK